MVKPCPDCGAAVTSVKCLADAHKYLDRRCVACYKQARHAGRKWTKEKLVAFIAEWADEHGRPPTAADFYGLVPAVQKEFGSWSAGIEAAGLEPLRRGQRRDPDAWYRSRFGDRPLSPEAVLDAMRAEAVDGVAGSSFQNPLRARAIKHFGSWPAACEAAGLQPRRPARQQPGSTPTDTTRE